MPNVRTYISSCSSMPLLSFFKSPTQLCSRSICSAKHYLILFDSRSTFCRGPVPWQLYINALDDLFYWPWLSWSELLAKWTYHSHTLFFQAYILDTFAGFFLFLVSLLFYICFGTEVRYFPHLRI